jgi:hypothetical protein
LLSSAHALVAEAIGMREFRDAEGGTWKAAVRERPGPDYKGRYYFWLEPSAGGEGIALLDVRWNSERTAQRTLLTMSEVELRRRLRSALARAVPAAEALPEAE